MIPEAKYWIPIGEQFSVNSEDLQLYYTLIHRAKEANTYPFQSGYQVLTAGLTENGNIVTGGNKEYALSDAFIHGETAVLSRIRDEFGDEPVKAIAFYSKHPVDEHSSACPCGNCRDILRKYCAPDMVFLEGNEDACTISRLSDYLFDDYHPLAVAEFEQRGVLEAAHAIGESVSVYLPDDLKNRLYGVSLVSKIGQTWRGSLYTNAGYDATTPLISAVLTWRNTLFPESNPEFNREYQLDLERIVIAARGMIPDVLYRDRQAALELDEVLMKHSGRTEPLPVFLVNLDEQDRVQQVYTTDTREWLPFPFSPGQFGMDEVLIAQDQLLTGE